MGNRNILYYAILTLTYTFVYIFLILYTFRSKLKFTFRKSMLIGACYNMIYTMILLVCDVKHVRVGSFALTMWFCGLFLVGMFTLRANPKQLFYFIFVIFNIHLNVLLISGLFGILYITPPPSAQQDVSFTIMTGIVLLIFIPFMCYLFLGLFKRVIDTGIDFINSSFSYILPVSFYMYTWLSKHSYIHVSGGFTGKNLAMLILSNVCVFLSYASVFQMIIKTNDSKQATERENFAKRIITMQREQYEELAANIEKTARLRHDLRHHFVAIRGYAKNNDLPGLNDYLDCYQSESLSEDEKPVCENHLVDVILRHYIAGVRENGVRVKISVLLPESFQFSNTELCTVLGNLIENAAEACGQQKSQDKFIEINTKMISTSMIAIMVRNSYDGDILQKGESFLSKKHKGVGIGISSIQAIAEKNGGSCSFSFADNVFSAHVLLIS